MKVRIYNEYGGYSNEKGEYVHVYGFETCFKGEIKSYPLYTSEDYSIGDIVEVSRSRNTGKYFIPKNIKK